MKRLKLIFSLETAWVGTGVTEEVTIEINDDATQEEIDTVIDDELDEWISRYVDYGYEIKEE